VHLQEYRFALQDACRIALAETVAARLGRLLIELAIRLASTSTAAASASAAAHHEEMASMACTTGKP